jgi:hypothetical protein
VTSGAATIGAVTTWIRRSPRTKLDELTELWHLPDESPRSGATSHLRFARCGSNLGVSIERLEELPDAGDRCPVCGGIHARGAAAVEA